MWQHPRPAIVPRCARQCQAVTEVVAHSVAHSGSVTCDDAPATCRQPASGRPLSTDLDPEALNRGGVETIEQSRDVEADRLWECRMA